MARIGAHVSIAGGLEKCFSRGEAIGCEAIQIFSKSQLQWRSAPLSMGTAGRFHSAWKESSIRNVVVHASYLINLGARDDTGVKSEGALLDEIERCDLLGVDDLVLHPGACRGEPVESTLELVVRRLEEILERTWDKQVRILLETMAGQGSLLGNTFDHFRYIFERLDWHSRIGLCLDTCHLFAAGFDMRTESSYRKLMGHIDSAIGLDRVHCWHLNDSAHPLARGLDRHASIGEGEIGLVPFSLIVNDPLWDEVPCIVETPVKGTGHAGDLEILRKLRGG